MSEITKEIVTPGGRKIVITENNGIRKFDLGVIVTDYCGCWHEDDADRIKRMMENIPSGLDSSVHFYLDKWQKGIVKPEGEKLLLVQYMDQSFRNLSARNERVANDHYSFKKFADICAVLKTDDLLTELPEVLWKHGIYLFEATDPDSFLRRDDRRYAPRFDCHPDGRELYFYWAELERNFFSVVLVGEQKMKAKV